ncbi:unnamed protein product [Lathyrus sativus]|nr:unnamed protein product [Lathyrus sativus]
MEATRRHRPRSFSGASGLHNQHDKRVGILPKKEVQTARSRDKTSPRYYYVPSPPHDWHTKAARKAPSQSSWWNDRDLSRKRRVAKYKLYAVPDKLKASLQKGFHHLKMTCMKILA